MSPGRSESRVGAAVSVSSTVLRIVVGFVRRDGPDGGTTGVAPASPGASWASRTSGPGGGDQASTASSVSLRFMFFREVAWRRRMLERIGSACGCGPHAHAGTRASFGTLVETCTPATDNRRTHHITISIPTPQYTAPQQARFTRPASVGDLQGSDYEPPSQQLDDSALRR